jgi:hypothetical protein
VTTYEILARSVERDEAVSFWGEVDVPVDGAPVAVELATSSNLAVRVEDEEGQVIPGAFVRLARASVGLLSLTTNVEADGTSQFTRLTPGGYTLAVNADGHRRVEVTVDHGVQTEPFVVTLEKGRGSRTFEAWRGPPGTQPSLSGRAASEGAGSSESPEASTPDTAARVDRASRAQLSVFAVDPYGGPVTGAWVEVWSQGRMVSSGLTVGAKPASFEVPAPFDGEVLVIHGGWGESSARARIDANAEAEVVLRLSDPLLSHTVGRGRLDDLDVIEELLGAELVEDGQKILIDARDPDSRARRSGVERGDHLMSIRRQDAAYELVVERGGRVHRLALR